MAFDAALLPEPASLLAIAKTFASVSREKAPLRIFARSLGKGSQFFYKEGQNFPAELWETASHMAASYCLNPIFHANSSFLSCFIAGRLYLPHQ